MKRHTIPLSIALFVASSSFSQGLLPKDRISDEMQTFYLHPSRELLDTLILSLDADSTFQKNENAHPPFIGFLVTAFSSYAPFQASYEDLAEKLGPSRDLVLYSLFLSTAKDTVLNWPEHSASTNDLLWGGFFASGDKRYIRRLISEMQFCDQEDSLMLMLTGLSAKWSLSSNARQYQRVRTILEQSVNESPDYLVHHIHESLNLSPSDLKNKALMSVREFKNRSSTRQIDSVHAIFDHNSNGLQLHCFLIADKKFFEEWQKPDTPQIIPVKTYKRGDDVFPIIVFATDGKDANGNADLSYDVTVTKPDGSVYAKFEQLTIWKDLPAPFMELVQQPIVIHLEATDPIGVYRVKSVVYENNKKARVDVDLSFRVTE